jgi:hypothetical protein
MLYLGGLNRGSGEVKPEVYLEGERQPSTLSVDWRTGTIVLGFRA